MTWGLFVSDVVLAVVLGATHRPTDRQTHNNIIIISPGCWHQFGISGGPPTPTPGAKSVAMSPSGWNQRLIRRVLLFDNEFLFTLTRRMRDR